MKNKTLKKIFLSLFGILFICVTFYLLLAYYYRNSFTYGTWLNGIYCTGKTIDEVNEELLSRKTAPRFQIVLRDQENVTLNAESFEYKEDYKKALVKEQNSQNVLLWGLNLLHHNKKILLPEVTCDLAELENILEKEEFMKVNNRLTAPRVEIIETGKGYDLFDNTKKIINLEYAKTKIITSILAGEKTITLDDGICYEEYNMTPKMTQTYQLWEKVREFQDFQIIYHFGETQEILDSSVVADWITKTQDGEFQLDDKGNLILNELMVAEYVASLASKYDTLGGIRVFQATRGELVTIEGGTYGNQLDQEAETQYLLNAFLQNNEADRTPEYTKTAKQQGTDDIGSTYIEIDLTKQTLYYYCENELLVTTPIVTGNTKLKRGTPERVCYVYTKQKNRVLRGPGYAAHVNFWMPVNGNIGIHDAKWRNEFGGEIYKTEGSHGCINTPYDAMKYLFEIVDVGTPVLMFY